MRGSWRSNWGIAFERQAGQASVVAASRWLQGGFPAYLRRDSEHLQGRWHVKTLRNLHVAEVYGEGLAPDAEVADLVDRQVPRQSEHDSFAIVPTQRFLLSILVRHANTLRRRRRTSSRPEFRVCGKEFRPQNRRRTGIDSIGSSRACLPGASPS